MKVNEHFALSTPKVLLVPYEKHHVLTYHDWMESEELQIATASERLSLEDEYDMQEAWRKHNDKLTFIVAQPLQDPAATRIVPTIDDSPPRLIGDINLFLLDGHEEDAVDDSDDFLVIGELELMIAVKEQRRRGFGRAALDAFIIYVRDNLDHILTEYAFGRDRGRRKTLCYLRVKIDAENGASIALFESIGFQRISDEPNYFNEVEMRRNIESMHNGCDGLRKMQYWLPGMGNGNAIGQ